MNYLQLVNPVFLKKNKLFLFAAILVLFFLFVVAISFYSPSQKQITSNTATPTNSIFPHSSNSSAQLEPGELKQDWGPVAVSDNDLQGSIGRESLSDGSTKYSYTSSNPNRPDVIITKNGLIIFQRQSTFNEKIEDYLPFLGKPEYTILGSNFYGPDAITYIYPSRGTALVANLKTDLIFEQLTFQPVAINEFEQKYGDDIIFNNQQSAQKKETLTGGAIKYTLSSSSPDRPNIVITTGSGYPIFQRFLISQSPGIKTSIFTKIYGQPRWIFKGSILYGSSASYYIYADYGFALIVNSQTDQVLEEQTFSPMKIEDYIKKYGDDIAAYP